jgi:hypothetical protein
MILSVHATFGAAVASLVPTHPVGGFVLGFLSHLAIDAIPHRDYDLISIETDPAKKLRLVESISRKFRLIRDMLLVSTDAVVGLCLAFLFFFDVNHPWIFLIGAIGSMVPDFLTFLYLVIEHRSLQTFFKLHCLFVHSKITLKLNQVLGVFVQFCTIGVLIALIYWLKAVWI